MTAADQVLMASNMSFPNRRIPLTPVMPGPAMNWTAHQCAIHVGKFFCRVPHVACLHGIGLTRSCLLISAAAVFGSRQERRTGSMWHIRENGITLRKSKRLLGGLQ